MVVFLLLWYNTTILGEGFSILGGPPKEESYMDEQRAVSEAQMRAHRKYMEKFVEIKVRVTPEKRAAIQEHAQAMGESATTFINRAIDHEMERDGQRPKEGAGE